MKINTKPIQTLTLIQKWKINFEFYILIKETLNIFISNLDFEVNGHKRFFVMSEFNQVILSLQKIKSKNLGQNQENLVNYLVKDYSFSSDEAKILIVEAVKAKVIKSVIYNGKTSHRIVVANCAGDATVLVPDTQEETSDGIVTGDTVILNEPEVSISTKDTATNTLQDIQEVDVSKIIERKFDIVNNNIVAHYVKSSVSLFQEICTA